MFVEARVDRFEVSEQFGAALADFVAGRVLQAQSDLSAVSSLQAAKVPGDWMLAIDVARAFSDHLRGVALSRLAMREHANDGSVRLAWARSLSLRGRVMEALEIAQSVRRDPRWGNVAYAMTGAIFASLQREQSYDRVLRDLRDSNDPRVAYELAYGAHQLARWDEGVELGTKAVDGAPRWPRAFGLLADLQMSNGQAERVEATIERGLAVADDLPLEMYRLYQRFASSRWDEGIALADQLAERWPERTHAWVGGSVAAACRFRDRHAEAERWAARVSPEMAARFRDAGPDRGVLWDAPLMVQQRDMCVPVCMSLIAARFGERWSAPELYQAMEGFGGTALWRAADEARARGFGCVGVRADPAVMADLLRRGLCLIGPLLGSTSSHVEVICGFDPGLGVFWLRDPASWIRSDVAKEAIEDRYRGFGGVLAFGPADLVATVDANARSADAEALMDMGRAIHQQDIGIAEQCFGSITAPTVRLQAHWTGSGVVVSPAQVKDYEQRSLFDEEVDLNARLSVLMSRAGELERADFERAIAAMEGVLGSHSIRYLRVLRAVSRGYWDEAQPDLDQLVARNIGGEHIWQQLAEYRLQQGDLAGAREAATIAREMAPTSLGIHAYWRELHEGVLDIEARGRELAELTQRFPYREDCLRGESLHLYSHGVDGDAVTEKLQARVRRFPRSPDAWRVLEAWFATQGRDDLCEQVRTRALAFLSKTELDGPPIADVFDDSPADSLECMDAVYSTLRASPDRPFEEWHGVRRLRERDADGRLDRRTRLRLDAAAYVARVIQQDEAEPPAPQRVQGEFEMTVFLDNIADLNLSAANAAKLTAWCEAQLGWEQLRHGRRARVLAGFYGQGGQLPRAQKLLADAHAAEPQDVDLAFDQARLLARSGDSSAAWERFGRVLALDPGHADALEWMQELANDTATRLRYLKRRIRKYPWSRDLRTELFVADPMAFDRARLRDKFAAHHILLWEARIGHDTDALTTANTALQRLGEIEQLPPADLELALMLRVACAEKQENFAEIETLSDRGTEEFPGTPYFWNALADLYRARSSDAALRLLVPRAIEAGAFSGYLANRWLEVDAGVDLPISTTQEAPEDRRLAVAEAWVSALNTGERLDGQLDYLRWCHLKLADADGMREELIARLCLRGERGEAVGVAESILERRGSEPYWQLVAARALELDFSRAQALYQSAWEQGGLVAALRGLGVLNAEHGRVDEARPIFREVLRRDPYDEVALSNLTVFGAEDAEVWPHYERQVAAGGGVDTQYLLAQALIVAVRVKKPLPECWGELAWTRLGRALQEGGFRDEVPRLARGLRAWFRMIGDQERAEAVGPYVGRRWGLWGWPPRRCFSTPSATA